jgi:putative Ca2+/H+ antiporter (TMEM165/GDT1 family)
MYQTKMEEFKTLILGFFVYQMKKQNQVVMIDSFLSFFMDEMFDRAQILA